MSTYTPKSDTMDPNLPPITSVPEHSRRYVQWKEEDVGLLLADLERPGQYNKWKENKSGYSKHVGEQIFKNNMNHEAIKFKVRWLESRFKRWNDQLTAPEVEKNEAAIQEIRGKMMKEFPYYDRCKYIFETDTSTDSPAVQLNTAPAEHIENLHRSSQNESNILIPEAPRMINNSSPTTPQLDTPPPSQEQDHLQFCDNKRPNANSNNDILYKKRRQEHVFRPLASYHLQSHPSSNDYSEERKIKSMELELELKKMDHQERMQEMKLEQLRLEIELQKLKRDTPFSRLSPFIMNSSEQ